MFGLESLPGEAHAVATVGLVLGEAVVLYVGYGTITGVVGSAIRDAVGGD